MPCRAWGRHHPRRSSRPTTPTPPSCKRCTSPPCPCPSTSTLTPPQSPPRPPPRRPHRRPSSRTSPAVAAGSRPRPPRRRDRSPATPSRRPHPWAPRRTRGGWAWGPTQRSPGGLGSVGRGRRSARRPRTSAPTPSISDSWCSTSRAPRPSPRQTAHSCPRRSTRPPPRRCWTASLSTARSGTRCGCRRTSTRRRSIATTTSSSTRATRRWTRGASCARAVSYNFA
uniref:Uncharacterized protein n=1 Tax=Triticum urartu TaxID=4572 RepID=A0A8R7PA66_TRIUA